LVKALKKGGMSFRTGLIYNVAAAMAGNIHLRIAGMIKGSETVAITPTCPDIADKMKFIFFRFDSP